MHSATLKALVLVALCIAAPASTSQLDFSDWLDALAVEARERGISQSTLDASLANVERIPAVIELDRRQPKEPGDFCGYIEARLTETRIERGRSLLKEHRDLLHRVSARYGVPARFVVALWGLETNFGDYQGEYSIIDALATLAYDERRGPLFRKQLFAALRIVDEGHQNPADLKGSWAGAMGQVQLMPTTFLGYAVDYDGDGRKDMPQGYLEQPSRRVRERRELPRQRGLAHWADLGPRGAAPGIAERRPKGARLEAKPHGLARSGRRAHRRRCAAPSEHARQDRPARRRVSRRFSRVFELRDDPALEPIDLLRDLRRRARRRNFRSGFAPSVPELGARRRNGVVRRGKRIRRIRRLRERPEAWDACGRKANPASVKSAPIGDERI